MARSNASHFASLVETELLLTYEIICPSIRPDFFSDLKASIQPEEIRVFNGEQFTSFSSLVNAAARSMHADILIFVNDKARPSQHHIHKMLDLLDEGFGLVGLYRFGFFGISRTLFETLGGFDEEFSDGGFEDNDFLIRLKLANVAVYLSEEVPYVTGVKSTWKQEASRAHFFYKYRFHVFSKIIFSKDKVNFRNVGTYLSWGNSILCEVPLTSFVSKFGKMLMACRVETEPLPFGRKFALITTSFFKNLSSVFLVSPKGWKYYR